MEHWLDSGRGQIPLPFVRFVVAQALGKLPSELDELALDELLTYWEYLRIWQHHSSPLR